MAKLLQKKQIERLLGRRLKRAAAIERAEVTVDREARTVEMSFSSDAPIEHWFGKLILNHAPACVRLDRIRAGGAFLLDHDRRRQVGVHESITTDGHKTRGVIRLSRSALGEEILQDIEDGIRTNTSVGLILHELHFVRETDEEGPVYQSDDWEPIENSLVSVPADTSVGVGRAADSDEDCGGCGAEGCEVCNPGDEGERSQPQVSGAARAATQPNTEVRTEMENPNGSTQESAAVALAREITEMGEILGEPELAREVIEEGGDLAALRAKAKAKRTAAQGQTQTPPAEPGAVAARQGADSLQLARTASRVQLKAFRGENGARQAHRFGNFLAAALHRHGPAVQFCREHGIEVRRAHSEGDNESGGFLVPTEFEQTIIDLRLQYGVFRPNANVVPMSAGRREQPRRKGGLKAYPIGAGKNNRRLTESKQGWDLVGLDPKKVGVLAKYEEELSEDWLLSTGDNFASEAAQAFAQYEDECGFIGDGTSDYHGMTGVIPRLQGLSNNVAHVAGIVVASGNLWSEIVKEDILALVGRLPSFARKSGQVKWFCTNEFWATVLCRIALSMGGVTMAEIEGEMRKVFLGQPVEEVEVMPHAEANSQIPLLYGNLAQAAQFGDRRGMTVKMTDSDGDDFDEDIQAWKATERFDINVHDVGNADATASKRKAGPVVALQTAAA